MLSGNLMELVKIARREIYLKAYRANENGKKARAKMLSKNEKRLQKVVDNLEMMIFEDAMEFRRQQTSENSTDCKKEDNLEQKVSGN